MPTNSAAPSPWTITTRRRDAFIQRLFEHFGVHAEDLGSSVLLLDPQYLSTDALTGLGEGPQAVTFDRDVALAREELPLLRMDHPMVAGAVDLLVSGEIGNAAFMVDDVLPPRTALLQAVFVLECIADRELDAERFLPPLPIIGHRRYPSGRTPGLHPKRDRLAPRGRSHH